MKTAADFPDDPDVYLRVLAMDCGMDFSRDIPTPDPHLLSLLSKHNASNLHVIPTTKTNYGIRVHISDPLDHETVDVLRHIFHDDIDAVVTPREIIDIAIEQNYKS